MTSAKRHLGATIPRWVALVYSRKKPLLSPLLTQLTYPDAAKQSAILKRLYFLNTEHEYFVGGLLAF